MLSLDQKQEAERQAHESARAQGLPDELAERSVIRKIIAIVIGGHQ